MHFEIHRCDEWTALFGCYMADAMWNCCRLSAFCVHHTTMHHVMSLHAKPHASRVHTCLAITCHQHFWQSDHDLFHATVVRLGWNRYRNKSQHRKLTQEKKILLPILEPVTFWSWVQRSNHWAVPAPLCWHTLTCLEFATVPTLKQCWIYIYIYNLNFSAHL